MSASATRSKPSLSASHRARSSSSSFMMKSRWRQSSCIVFAWVQSWVTSGVCADVSRMTLQARRLAEEFITDKHGNDGTISSSSFSLAEVFILEAPDTMSSKTLWRISSICALSKGSGVELSAPRIISESSSGAVAELGAISCMMSDSARTGPSRAMTRSGDGPNTTKAIQRVLYAHVSQDHGDRTCCLVWNLYLPLFDSIMPRGDHSHCSPHAATVCHLLASFPHLKASSPTGYSRAPLSFIQQWPSPLHIDASRPLSFLSLL